ncbi:hypothetical protein K2X30_12135 [bacterium]|nr:hypothetical protein [bacterium]
MKKTFLCLATLASLWAPSAHAWGGTIALAGDSWAWLPCLFNSVPGAIRTEKLLGVDFVACQSTSGMQIHAENWLGRKEHQNILSVLRNRKDVNVLYFSMGGNDFMKYWRKTMTPQEEQAMNEKIRNWMEAILKEFLAVRPDFKILISGYDYPRFFTEHASIPNYDKLYKRAGEPSIVEINSALQRFTLEMLKLADNKRVFYIHHLGVAQYYHGSKDTGLQPFTTLAPALISSSDHPERMGGDVNSETDRDAMLGAVGYIDSYHLSPNTFTLTVRHSIQQYLRDWFQAP